MKLAMVTHNIGRLDGQGRVSHEIVRYALSKGAEVTLLAAHVDQDLLDLGAIWLPIKPSLHCVNLLKVLQFVPMANGLLNSLPNRFDIVQGFGYTLTLPHQINGCQFVHDAWGRCTFHAARVHRNFYGLYQGIYTHMNRYRERESYAHAQYIVACSNQVKQDLITIGVPESRIRIILNAVDSTDFIPGLADRNSIGLPPDVPLALFVGDIQMPRKNLDTVLKTLPSIPSLHLAVVGTTKGSPYPNMASKLGVSERVHFLGFRRDVAKIMQASDLFIFPSRYEPFGIVLLEAMATGLPVITSQTVGAAQIITPECGIVLQDPNDVGAMVKALQALLTNPAKCRTMGKAGRKVAEQHSWQHMAGQYWNLYNEVMR